MERSRTHCLADDDHKRIRAITFVIPVATLLVTGVSFPTVGLALDDAPPQTDARGTSPTRLDTQPLETRGRMQAPVGHRQPRVQDLPPSVLRKENGQDGRFNAEIELDQKLGICKGC
jgi:hypothetical protein